MVPPTVILVDEAQTTKDDKYFWNTAGSNPVEIPSITPPVLSRIQRVELQWYGTDKDQAVGLYLSREEADEIFDKMTSYHQDRPIYGVDIRDYVYAVTSGHAGALASLIGEVTKHRDIRRHYILKGLAITSACEQYLFRDISGNRFYDLLRESPFGRGLPPRSCSTNDRYASALNQLLRAPFGYVPSVPRNNALDICYSMGWVHEAILGTDPLGEEIRGYIFPSPLHKWIVARHLIPRAYSTNPSKRTPLQLTSEILRRFVPSSLSDASLSPRSGRPETCRTPPEALYGQEFFRAAHKVLEGHAIRARSSVVPTPRLAKAG
ncbi:hypothetical protein BDD12DRAFT_891107 [Trichophaea hybrida]|nr:hypothetical protein BDD12DRAFT_891107 [Trichophaea hybrida]